MSSSGPPTLREIQAGYDRLAQELGQGFFMGDGFYRACLAAAGRVAGRVADVGCGGGGLLRLLRERWPGARTFAGDLSPGLLRLARERAPGAHLAVSDAQRLPWRTGGFDVAFMTEVLEHLLDYPRALAEIQRILKPGAVFVVTVPNRDWVLYEQVKDRRDKYQPVDDHFFAYDEIRALLEDAGLRIERCRGQEMLYYHRGWRLWRDRALVALWPPLRRRMKRLVFTCRRP